MKADERRYGSGRMMSAQGSNIEDFAVGRGAAERRINTRGAIAII